MASISGRLMFDRNRTAVASGSLSGIANVSIVLQNIDTGLTLAVLTSTSGNYTFTNVPNGHYQIVEAYGFEPAVATPGDFSAAEVATLLSGGITPPISYATSPPVGATHLDCTIKNTRTVNITGPNSTGNNFLNGPVTYTPISAIIDEAVVISPDNLVVNADNGTFGIFPVGINANMGASPLPYTNLGTDFAYVLPNPSTVTPNDGQFTIQNIMNNSYSNGQGTWWIIADRSEGNETGRMMVVNGYNPGAVIFKETVTVEPDSYYLFSAWILNLCKKSVGFADPALGVTIFDEAGAIMYEATLGELVPIKTTNPEWKQIGTIFSTHSNTTLTLQFVSMGPAATGNDYAIDDISINKVSVPVYNPIKTANKTVANVGEPVEYTVTLANTGQQPLTDVVFKDVLPEGMVFIDGSVYINGVNNPSANPNLGFTVPDIVGEGILTVVFSAAAESVPAINPTINQAQITYMYSPVYGGIPMQYDTETNEVPVKILYADLMLTKTAGSRYAAPGDTVIYTLTVLNNGPSDAEGVVITDIVPAGLTDVQFSIDEGLTWTAWEDAYNVGTLEADKTFRLLISGVVSSAATETIENTAKVSADTFDPDLSNNEDAETITIADSADLMIEKSSQPNFAMVGNLLTYILKVSNLGPSAAQNVTVYDEIPPVIANPQYSADNGLTWNTWTGSLVIGTLASGDVVEIFIRGIVRQTFELTVSNTATVNSTTPDPDMSNNSSTIVNDIITPMDDMADIAITKTAAPNPCVAGEILTYTIKVTNYGPNGALDVVLNDNMPKSLLNPEFSTDGDIWQKWDGQYLLGALLSGETRTILIRGTVSSTAFETIINTANVDSSNPDPDLSNNTSTAKVQVKNEVNIDLDKAINIVIASIGLEEISLAHILNAEGEKIQYVLGTLNDRTPQGITVCDVIQTNNSVNKMLKNVIKTEMLLQFKLEDVMDLSELEK